jgi:hypothetical protein
MSLESWTKEFLPEETAYQIAEGLLEKVPTKYERDKAALAYAAWKWRGTLPLNLKKHGVALEDGDLTEIDGTGETLVHKKYLGLADENCVLCQMYVNLEEDCRGCPLYLARDGCNGNDSSEAGVGGTKVSPWHKFADGDGGVAMRRLLRDGQKWFDEQSEVDYYGN